MRSIHVSPQKPPSDSPILRRSRHLSPGLTSAASLSFVFQGLLSNVSANKILQRLSIIDSLAS